MGNHQGREQQEKEPFYRQWHQWSAEEVDRYFKKNSSPPRRFRPASFINRTRGIVDRRILHDGLNIFDIVEPLPIVIPPKSEHLLGYEGDSRYIGMNYDMRLDRPIITDGVVSVLGCTQAWDVIHNQPTIQDEIATLNFNTSCMEPAHHCYLLDREDRGLYIGEYEPIMEFLEIWTADLEIDNENLKRLRRMAFQISPPHKLTRREEEIFIQQRKHVVSYCVHLEQKLANL